MLLDTTTMRGLGVLSSRRDSGSVCDNEYKLFLADLSNLLDGTCLVHYCYTYLVVLSLTWNYFHR